MSGFIGALIKQRRDAKKAGPDTSGRLKEIIDITMFDTPIAGKKARRFIACFPLYS